MSLPRNRKSPPSFRKAGVGDWACLTKSLPAAGLILSPWCTARSNQWGKSLHNPVLASFYNNFNYCILLPVQFKNTQAQLLHCLQTSSTCLDRVLDSKSAFFTHIISLYSTYIIYSHTLFHCILMFLFCRTTVQRCEGTWSRAAMVGDPGLPIHTYPLSIPPAFLRPGDKITQHVRRLTLTLVRLWATKTQKHQQAEIFTAENDLPQFSAKPDKWFTTPREVRSALVINFWHLKSLVHYFEGSG